MLLSLPVAFHCLWSLGFQSGDDTTTRVMAHSIVGCAVYGALVVKVVAVRSKSAPGWFLPIAGGLLFSVIVTVVWTSAIWYLGDLVSRRGRDTRGRRGMTPVLTEHCGPSFGQK